MPRSIQRFGIASAIFLLCVGCYLSNGRTAAYKASWDTIPTRLLPFSMLRYHTMTLEPFREDFTRAGFRAVADRRGLLTSSYPIGASLMAVPIYAPYYAALRLERRASRPELFAKAEVAEKAATSLIVALSVALLFCIVATRLGDARATFVALTFGLGTVLWATATQALWQHGPDVLCLLLAMLGLSWRQQNWRTRGFTGFALGLAIAIRPQMAPFLLAGAVAEWLIADRPLPKRFRALVPFLIGSLPPIAFTIAYNSYFFGNPLGPYHGYESGFQLSTLMTGAPALLLSPNRGLLVFSPIAALGFWGMAIALRHPREHPIEASFSAAAIVYFILHASFYTWAAGPVFGPRYLIETLPVLALASALAIPRIPMTRMAIVAVALAIGWSVLVEWNGAFCYPASNWNGRMQRQFEERAWDFRHFELWEDFRAWIATRGTMAAPRYLPAPPIPLPDTAFRVKWGGTTTPGSMEAGGQIPILVNIRNESTVTWPDLASSAWRPVGGGAVRLSYRWRTAGSPSPASYGIRSDLRAPLQPGESTTLSILVTAPGTPGAYQLQFDLVQELVAWFEDKGSQTLLIPVSVK